MLSGKDRVAARGGDVLGLGGSVCWCACGRELLVSPMKAVVTLE